MKTSKCFLCNRSIVNSKSVIGSVCKKKYKVNEDVNILINLFIKSISKRQKIKTAIVIKEIREMGLDNLANCLSKKVSQIQIKESDNCVLVNAPFKSKLITEFSKLGFKYDPNNNTAIVPDSKKLIMFGVLKKNFSGRVVAGPKGLFVL